MRQITINVYEFGELSEPAQLRAVEVIRERLGSSWWDSADNDDIRDVLIATLAEQIGAPGWDTHGVADFPGIDGVTVDGWDLDRDDAISVSGILTRDHAPTLPWVEGIDQVELTSHHRCDVTTITVHDSDPDCTCAPDSYLQPHDDDCPSLVPSPATEEQRRTLEDAVREALHHAWQAGEREYEYKTGEGWAREIADSYEFTADGELYP